MAHHLSDRTLLIFLRDRLAHLRRATIELCPELERDSRNPTVNAVASDFYFLDQAAETDFPTPYGLPAPDVPQVVKIGGLVDSLQEHLLMLLPNPPDPIRQHLDVIIEINNELSARY